MTLPKTVIVFGVLALAAAPGVSHAAGLTITDDGSTISWTAHSDNFADTVTIDGTDYGNYYQNNDTPSGTQAASSVFTAVFSGSFVGGPIGYDTAVAAGGGGPFVPEYYFFEDAVGDILASLSWTSDGVNDTATFTDYAAGAGTAPASVPSGGTAVALNTQAGIGYFGFGGSAEVTGDAAAVAAPEPTSIALLGTGLTLAGWLRRRR